MRQEHLLLLLVGLLLGAYLWHRASRAYQRMKTQRRFRRAHKKEAEAAVILEEYGYRVLGAQVEGSVDLTQDGEPLSAALRADYWVEKGGRSFIAEAKSGGKVINVLDRGTRRQLLEYLVSYEVDGVLLVNTEDRVVSEVCFPLLRQRPSSSRFGVGVLVGGGLCLLWQLLCGAL